MVIGLLTLAAIPSTIAIAEGISEQKNRNNAKKDEKRLRKFHLSCWCEGKSPGKSDVHQGMIVVGDEKVWVQSPKKKPKRPFHPFEGFYIEYPDEQRPPPTPLGLVSKISDNPPMMNWIYVVERTLEVKHGNRTQSRDYWVGDWGSTNDEEEEGDAEEEEDPGGLVFEGEEKFVAVEPEEGDEEGRWEIRWDENDDKLKNGKEVGGRRVLRVSLERTFIAD